MSGFGSDGIAEWAKPYLMPGSHVFSDGLACFRALTTANCNQKSVFTSDKRLNDLPQLRWIITLLGKLKSSLKGTFQAFNVEKYANRYRGSSCFRFNSRISMT